MPISTFAHVRADTVLHWEGLGSADSLRNRICRFGPQIVRVNSRVGKWSHFVLGIGMTDDESTLEILDPAGGVIRGVDYYGGALNTRQYQGAQRTDTLLGDIVITFHSPGELVLTDPLGRRVGYDPINGATYAEVPGAAYDSIALSTVTGPGQVIGEEKWSKEVYVHGPISGAYTVDVAGTGTGTYILQITGYAGYAEANAEYDDVPITPGEVHSYTFQFDKSAIAGEQALPVGGGFSGGGQRSDVDAFLTYSRPAQRRVDLPAGTTTYPLMLFYAATTLPGTFRAELNSADVTGLFHAAPGSSEVVSLPLTSGRNVLLLTIEGDAAGHTATDRDRLTFIVP